MRLHVLHSLLIPLGETLPFSLLTLWFDFPGTLTQAIRNFAKSLEGWLTNAMRDFPQQVIQTKVTPGVGGWAFRPRQCPEAEATGLGTPSGPTML